MDSVLALYSEIQTAVDKRCDRGAAFLGRDTRALHVDSGCLLLPAAENLSATQQQTTRASMQLPCVSARERRARSRPLSTAVWSSP
ncbi:hypothetical protein Y032_0008g282 [Ancylostoma ceylanicum]|uniref:Uncharacterized protein n=1 Tax=Ancylostoma ceylanicum TaxID=53326 RepID=A0A016VL48_9BILA|nr:hypothetical protein Y032_0008g282 [Ancylostoma ceylanicum]